MEEVTSKFLKDTNMSTIIPNWQHHSNKDQKWTRKPRAQRSARARLKALIKKLRRKYAVKT